MSSYNESDSQGQSDNQYQDPGSVTHTIPSERDVIGYSVSDHELDSLSTFTTLPSVFFSLTMLFLTVGFGGIITLLNADWLFTIAMVAVGLIFAGLGVWAFRKKKSYIDRIRSESRPRSQSE